MTAGTFTEEQIIALLQDAQKGEKTVEELYRDLGDAAQRLSTSGRSASATQASPKPNA